MTSVVGSMHSAIVSPAPTPPTIASHASVSPTAGDSSPPVLLRRITFWFDRVDVKLSCDSAVKNAPSSVSLDCRLMCQSPSAGFSDRSSGRSSETVTIVPAGNAASSGASVNTSVALRSSRSCDRSRSHNSICQPRRSRPSSITTNSNQSPPLPSTSPKAGSSPPTNSRSPRTALYSFIASRVGPGWGSRKIQRTFCRWRLFSVSMISTSVSKTPASFATPLITPVVMSMNTPGGSGDRLNDTGPPSGSKPSMTFEIGSPTL